MFEPEYAEVLRRPVQLPADDRARARRASRKPVLTVRALPERANLRIEFPRVIGYRYEMPTERLTATFDDDAHPRALDPTRSPPRPSWTRSSARSNLLHAAARASSACNTVVFAVAKRTLDNYFRDEDGGERPVALPAARRDHPALDRRVRHAVPQATAPTRSCCCSPSAATPRPSGSTGRSCTGTDGEQRLMPDPAPLRRRSARPTTSSSRPRRPASTRRRATSTASPRTRAGRRSSPQKLESMPEVVALRQEPGPQPQDPVHVRGPRRATTCPDFLIRLRDADSTGRRRPPDARPRGHRRGEEGEAGQGRRRARPLGPGRQQLGRPGPLGVPRGHRPMGRGEPDPLDVPRVPGRREERRAVRSPGRTAPRA